MCVLLVCGILIESMRREGYEFEIRPPKVRSGGLHGGLCGGLPWCLDQNGWHMYVWTIFLLAVSGVCLHLLMLLSVCNDDYDVPLLLLPGHHARG